MKITPEVIIDRFGKRLAKKYKSSTECEWLLYSGNGVEKWFQCEMFLAFAYDCYPWVVDADGKNIVVDGDRVADMLLETTITLGGNDKRPDLGIVEKPFIYKYLDDPDQWEIKKVGMKEEVKEAYKHSWWNYIELKVEGVDLDEQLTKTSIPKGLLDDLKTIKYGPHPDNQAASLIALSVVVFNWKSEAAFEKIYDIIEKIVGKIKEIDKSLESGFYQIDGNVFILYGYRSFEKKK